MPVSDLRGQIRSWQGAQARKINLVSAARRSPPRITLHPAAPLRRRRQPRGLVPAYSPVDYCTHIEDGGCDQLGSPRVGEAGSFNRGRLDQMTRDGLPLRLQLLRSDSPRRHARPLDQFLTRSCWAPACNCGGRRGTSQRTSYVKYRLTRGNRHGSGLRDLQVSTTWPPNGQSFVAIEARHELTGELEGEVSGSSAMPEAALLISIFFGVMGLVGALAWLLAI
jgi:hypothetical protein